MAERPVPGFVVWTRGLRFPVPCWVPSLDFGPDSDMRDRIIASFPVEPDDAGEAFDQLARIYALPPEPRHG